AGSRTVLVGVKSREVWCALTAREGNPATPSLWPCGHVTRKNRPKPWKGLRLGRRSNVATWVGTRPGVPRTRGRPSATRHASGYPSLQGAGVVYHHQGGPPW